VLASPALLKFLTPALSLLLLVSAPAQPAAPPKTKAGPTVEDRLMAAAESSREALISFEVSRPGLAADELITYRGFFISSDGLAVAPLQAFETGRFTAKLELDGSPVAIPGLIAVDHAYGMAIIRTDQRPTRFLVLAPIDSALGERVAILRAKENGGTITAPILAIRKAPIPRSQKYLKILSVGANLGAHGTLYVPAGTPIFNAKGLVTGCLYPPSVNARQRFLFAAPASTIARRVPPNSKAAATIPFPLPASLQPADPLALDASYLLGRTAQMRGELVEAERLLRRALARQPKSAAGWQRLGYVLRDRKHDQEAMEAFQKAVAHGNQLGTFLLNQADQYTLMGKLDKATEFLKAACEHTPFDYDLHRAYAIALRTKKDNLGAEKHLRIATKLAPDALISWNLLSQCLAAQAKWDDEKIASNKIFELEGLYRPR
jgi:tetratricopeptide (TPR) repeat protein